MIPDAVPIGDGGAWDPVAAAERLRRGGERPALLLDGDPAFDGAWGPLVAVVCGAPRRLALDELDAALRRRRAGGHAGTGVAAVFEYGSEPVPLAFAVEASLVREGGEVRLVASSVGALAAARDDLARPSRPGEESISAGRLRTSLPREAYVAGVRRVLEHIARGDVYQANLTQRFEAPFPGNPFSLYRRLRRAAPAPRAAYFEALGSALASVSPEVFVDASPDGRVETRPIKGTRPRHRDPAADEAAAAALARSAKDRAELTMIVDLERNDLGCVCRTGSVVVPEMIALRTYPAVHHLVARIEGRLLVPDDVAGLWRAVFPGGSITGAPKRRAIEILRSIEPVPRGWYTGALAFFGDDGSTRSSILIRSAVVRDGRVFVGAGGGVVAESDPEGEWMESNAKARAVLEALGREPEEAR